MTEEQPKYEVTQESEQSENLIVRASMRDPNISSKSTKDGMECWFKAKIPQEDFDMFRSLPLVGMVIEATLELTNINEGLFSDAKTEEREEEHKQKAKSEDDDPYRKKPIGVLCKEITRDYCPAPKLQKFCADVVWSDSTKVSAHYAGEAVKRWIGFKSRKSVDYDDKAKAAWLKMIEVYHTWLKDQKTKPAGQEMDSQGNWLP